jgi:hypothetical protein
VVASAVRRSLNTGGENPEFLMRDFMGVNCNDAREAINDDEFFWLENIQPLAHGNAQPVLAPGAAVATISGETGNPSYTCTFSAYQSAVQVNYVFAAWSNSGNAWIINLSSGLATRIMAGLLSSSGGTCAVQYGNQGLLIIDPNGYWDYNVSAPFAITSQNNSIAGASITFNTSVAGGVTLTNSGLTPGTGGDILSYYQVISATISTAGTGYVVGDVLSFNDGLAGSGGVASSSYQAQVTVASIGGSGAITGITLSYGGSYAGPQTGLTQALPSGSSGAISGGSGTGAAFTLKLKAIPGSTFVVTPGNGYTAGTTTSDKNGATVITTASITTSGVIGGTTIAVYAGRVWIGFQRTIYVTNINSYNYFGGAGFTFTINDAYLLDNITCLFAANNYLYIFGKTSIDALSNVVVTSGVTSFSRINIVTGVGVANPNSVFPYYRAVGFADSTGFYLLAGATPEKVSEKISGVIREMVTLAGTNQNIGPYGCLVNVNGELCYAMQFFFTDIITNVLPGVLRAIVALYFRQRWWFASFPYTISTSGNLGFVSLSINRVWTAYFWAQNAFNQPVLYPAFNGAAIGSWILKTKLWDGGGPLREKEAVNTALAAIFGTSTTPGIYFSVDTEGTSSANTTYPLPTAFPPNQYDLSTSKAVQGGSQYLGLTLAYSGIGNTPTQLNLLALRGKQDRNMLL